MVNQALIAYAGPIVASLAINGIWAAITTACVYAYLHRERIKRMKIIDMLTRPLQRIVKKIAIKQLANRRDRDSQ